MNEIEQKVTLWDIRLGLQALAEIDIEALTDQERADYQAALDTVLLAEVKKVDGVARVLFELMKRACLAEDAMKPHQDEIERLKKRAARFKAQADRLRERVLGIIVATVSKPKRGPRELVGETATLKAKGVAPMVELIGGAECDPEYVMATISLPVLKFRAIRDYMAPGTFPIDNIAYTIDKRALLEALKQPCPHCGGSGEWTEDHGYAGDQPIKELVLCQECRGNGKRQIPGARLIEDRYRLVVE